MKKSVEIMIENIKQILGENINSIYLYGSCTTGDFKLGWSDIDILVLTKTSIEEREAQELLQLRQRLLEKEPDNLYYRSFEGGMLSLEAFLNQTQDKVVYWGTKGEKIKNSYQLDSFSKLELISNGQLLFGEDVRSLIKKPSFIELRQDVEYHYQTIREHAQKTGRNFYSFGWFLDISRCLYTLKTGKTIAKTKAGEWALQEKLCPVEKELKFALEVRNNPLKYKHDEKVFDYAETLGEAVQKYADVLEQYLNLANQESDKE